MTRPREHIVYGFPNGQDRLVFIPEGEAKELAQVWDALRSAKTWGEFRQSVPPSRWEEAVMWFWDDGAAPGDDEEFDGEALVSAHDYDWPPWTEQLMLDWVPKDIQDRFGDRGSSMVSGDSIAFYVASEREIVAALQQAGYICIRDDRLVAHASGQT